MNKATAKLNLSSMNGEQDMEEDVEGDEDEFNVAIDREEESELNTSYVVHRSDLPDLSFKVDPNSDDKEGKDFSEDDLSVHLEDHSLGQDYDSSLEVASGVFDASYANKFEEIPMLILQECMGTRSRQILHVGRVTLGLSLHSLMFRFFGNRNYKRKQPYLQWKPKL
jgi:hypothetical protein